MRSIAAFLFVWLGTCMTVAGQKNLVINGGFEDGLSGWNANEGVNATPWVFKEGKGSAAFVSMRAETGWIGMDQSVDLPRKAEALDVCAWIKGEHLVQGKETWNTALVIVDFYKGSSKMGDGIHVASLVGSRDWTLVDKKIKVPAGASSFKLMVALSSCTGSFYIDGIVARTMLADSIPGMERSNPVTVLVPDVAPSVALAETKALLVDKQVTNATAALFFNLRKSAHSHILFGHQSDTRQGVVDSTEDWVNSQQSEGISRRRSDVKDISGAYPAVYGFDFNVVANFNKGDWFAYEQYIARELTIDAYNRGGVVTYCWHYQNPVSQQGFYWKDSPVDAVAAILPGGKSHEVYKASLKQVANYAKSLVGKDGRLIPVIFRPFHEFDGDWFWWGKPHCTVEQYKALYQFTVTYLRDELGVHNFLYAWSPDRSFVSEPEYLERYPGDGYVDLVGTDNYWDLREGSDPAVAAAKFKVVSDYARLHNKVGALTETGLQNLTQPDWYTAMLLKALRKEPLEFAYVLVWANSKSGFWTPYKGHAAVADFLQFKDDPYVLFGDKVPDMYSIQ